LGGIIPYIAQNNFWEKFVLFWVFIIMNRSYSKIRHIQESNQRLESRLLSEQMDGMEEFKQELQDVGEPMSDEEIQELQPECSISNEVPEHADIVRKFEEELKGMSIPEIKNKIKELKAIQKNNKIQEKGDYTVKTSMDGIGMGFAKGVVGLLILLCIIGLFKKIFGGGTRTNKACRQRNRLVRRYGLRGATM